MKTVPRIGRLLDLAGLLLFVVGGAIAAWAWLGFQGVPELAPALEEQARSAVAVANRYWRLQKIGTGFMIAGGAVFVLAWWVARDVMRASAEPNET